MHRFVRNVALAFTTIGVAACGSDSATGVEPFTDMDVRLALKYAIDRDAIIKGLLRGYGVAAKSILSSLSSP